jgi:hypothetical protein
MLLIRMRQSVVRCNPAKIGRLLGGMGDDDENASGCDDGSGFGDGVLGASERGTDVPAADDAAGRAATTDTRISFAGTDR